MAVDGGVFRHLLAAVARYGSNGRNVTSHGAGHCADAYRRAVYRCALRCEYLGRVNRRVGYCLLVGANIGSGLHSEYLYRT